MIIRTRQTRSIVNTLRLYQPTLTLINWYRDNRENKLTNSIAGKNF